MDEQNIPTQAPEEPQTPSEGAEVQPEEAQEEAQTVAPEVPAQV